MTEQQFYSELQAAGIDCTYVCFNNVIRDDVYSVREYYGQYEVCYRERGKEYKYQRYSSFSDIIQYLKSEMRADTVKHHKDDSLTQNPTFYVDPDGNVDHAIMGRSSE